MTDSNETDPDLQANLEDGYVGHALDPDVSRRFAEKFLDAQTIKYVSSVDEDDNVKTLIDQLEAEYDVVWKDLGRMENNYGLIESSQGSKMGALVEIITNAFDAVLVCRYRERHGESYDASHDIATYDAAGQLLFDEEERLNGPGGSDTDGSWVELYADGGGRRGDSHGANFVVCDRGEGKPPEEFETTFLDVLKPGQTKRNWPFLQGQFGMGGSAVLSYCGKGYKFIASASVNQPEVWTWSIVRRNRERSTYEYLTISGRVPTFIGEFADREVGSIVKMFDYEDSFPQVPGQGAYDLGRTLYDIPMAMRLDDRRGYTSRVQDRNWYGHKYTLENTATENGYIEEQFTITHDFGGAETDDGYVELGEINAEVFVFKSDEAIRRMTKEGEFGLDPETPREELDDSQQKRLQNRVSRKSSYRGNTGEHRDRAVSLVVNGQVHGDFGRRALTGNRVGLDNVGKDLLVYIDFSSMNGTTLTDTFQSNRSYINDDKPLGQQVRDEVYDMLQGNETLEQYEEERKRSRRKREHDEKDIKTIESILEENPHLTQFFGSFGEHFPSVQEGRDGDLPAGVTEEGSDTTSTAGTGDTENWIDLNYVPTTLEVLKRVKQTGEPVPWDGGETGDEPFVREIPVSSTGWVKFRLDAVNDYFTREREHGERIIVPDEMVVDSELVGGILGVRIEPFDNAKPGDMYTVTVEVTRPDASALTEEFKIRCVEERDPTTTRQPDPEQEPDDASDFMRAIGEPDIDLVEQSEWEEYGFNEDTVVNIVGDDPREFTYEINVDAAPVASFRERKNLNPAGEEIVNDQWAAIVFYMALGSYMKWAIAIDRKLRENGMTPLLDDDLLPDSPEEQEQDPLLPNEDDVEQVVNELDARTADQLDPRRMAAASMAGSVHTLLDWRFDEDDLDGLTE
jgi:hypothetical protein